MAKDGPELSTHCFTCQVRERGDWCALHRDDFDLLDRHKKVRNYEVGDILFMEGDECIGIHCIETGAVALRKTDIDGNSVLVHLSQAGETIGYRSFLSGERYDTTCEVVAPSKICFIPGATVRQLIDHNPSLGMQFLAHAARDVREAQDNYLRASTGSVRARLVHLLFTLKDRYAEEQDDGSLVIHLPLSRQDMAAMVGTRPETISRTIRKMEADGAARFEGRDVRIVDPEMLLEDLSPLGIV